MAWCPDDMHTFALDKVRVEVGKNEKLAAACANFLHVGLYFFQQRVIWRDHNNRHTAVDQCKWPMLELSRRVGFGMNVRNFLEFERALKRDRVVQPAPQKKRVLFFRKSVSPRLDLWLQVQGVLDSARQVAGAGGRLGNVAAVETRVQGVPS